MSNPTAAAETPSVLSAVHTPASSSIGSTDGAITDGGSGGHTSGGSKSETDPDLRHAGEHERTNHDNASLSYEYGPELLERNRAYRGLFESYKLLRSCVESGTSPSVELKSTYDRAQANLQAVIRKHRPCNTGWVPPGGMEETWSRWGNGTTHAPTSELYEEAKSQYDKLTNAL
ncbi:uncharacterized protein L199_008104 [Kwoniella botswanensis]|uniref:uncharacterized protein n=1 Tax=Kwoniella botswanensis TaxID=1268659 RepID=UPI00315D7228